MKIIDLPLCPGCGAIEFVTFDIGAGNILRRCRSCDTVSALEYADPAEVYVDGYMFGEAGAFGIDVTHPSFQELLNRIGHRRMEFIESVSGGPGSLLDVGCGTGEVLAAARDRGWTVQGVEPERTAAEMAGTRGLDVAVATLEESGLPEGSWDVVSAFHVLEHQPDSPGFLGVMARWARPGGLVAVEVPNFKSVQRRRLRERWGGLRPLEHIVHFTPETLGRAFRAAGLEPVLLQSAGYIGTPQNLQHAIDDLVRGPRFRRAMAVLSPRREVAGEHVRYPSRAGWAVLMALQALYDRVGAGQVAVCIGRVP
jgi:SAM-dependent methyltransferase